jgi:hypothetical protein
MKRNYAIPALLAASMVSTASFGMVGYDADAGAYDHRTTHEDEERLRKEYDDGLEKLAKEKLSKLQAILKYALDQDINIFKNCIKEKGKEQCQVHEDRAERRKANLKEIEGSKSRPLNFAQRIVKEMLVHEKPAGVVPHIQDPDYALYSYRKDNLKRERGEAGDLDRRESWKELEDAIGYYQSNFEGELRSKYGFPTYNRARVNALLGLPAPQGLVGKTWDGVKSLFGWKKPDTGYTSWVQQYIGQCQKPFGNLSAAAVDFYTDRNDGDKNDK